MAAITISNLSSDSSDLSFSKLTDSEMDNVCGGLSWDEFKESVRDWATGVADGIAGKSSKQSNLNYLNGNIGGLIFDEASEWIPG